MPARKTVLIPGKNLPERANKGGRPKKGEISPSMIKILDKVASGQSLELACRGLVDVTPSKFRGWCRSNQDLRVLWRQAREEQAHSRFDQMLDLIDRLAQTKWTREDNAAVTALRTAVDGLKHTTARLLPRDYGEQKTTSQPATVVINTNLDMGPGTEVVEGIFSAKVLAPPSKAPLDASSI